MYSQQELDEAVMKERERCLEKCRMVMDHHANRENESDSAIDKRFHSGQSCGAEDCIEAICGAWD